MRKLITLTLLLALFAASCQKDDLSNEISSEANFDALFQDIKPLQNTDLIPQSEIDKTIIETLVNEGEYKWVNSTDEHLWSAVNYGDSIASIGYKPANMGDISDIMHTIDVSHVDWMRARHTIIELLVEEERKATNNPGLTKEDVIIEVHETIPVIFARVSGYYSLAKTRRLPQTRYVEPLGYDVRPETVEINVSNKSGGSCPPKNHTKNFNVWDPLRLGCSNEADPNTNYSLVQPNYSIVPWHYKHSRVRIFNAWNHSQGDNITIGMIDSGTSPRQTKLNSQFATGWSTSRSITRVGKFNPWYPIPFTRPDGPNDNCGHGTLMAGCAAGPRNGYSTVGVAYKANLVAVRGADDVFLNSTQERKGVFESFVYLGNRSDVKIISMSMGYPWFWVQTLADGVNFAYGKQKLIFCAAGTSTGLTNWTGTIFPARMSNKVYAVTGVKDVWPTIKKRCKVCHAGGHVDFVVPMQKDKNRYGFSTDCEKTNSLMMEGNSPARVGGSSIATATMAGITALVWAKNPSMSRTSVVNILKNAADYYPNDHPDFGWGVVNAEAAVLAAAPAPAPMRVTINGPTSIQSSGYYTWTASTTNAPSAPSYNWSRLVTNPGMGYISSCNGTGNSYGCYVTVFGTGWGSFAKINVSATASGQTKTAVKNLTR